MKLLSIASVALCSSAFVALCAVAQTPADRSMVEPVPSHADYRVAQVQVRILPDHDDWTYKVGEQAKFRVEVSADNVPLKNATIRYEVGPEKFTAKPVQMVLENGVGVIDGGTMTEPGFMQCVVTAEVKGRKYRGLGTAAFEPENIQPTQANPDDFDAFWQGQKDKLSKVPMDVQMELLPERSRGSVNVYNVSFAVEGWRGWQARIYGVLAMPKAPGKYPALLYVPGAGVRPYNGMIDMAEKGVITLQIGIHGIPVNLDSEAYHQLRTHALDGYHLYNLDNKDRYYYRRVYLGCLRANDFLTSLPEWNGKALGVVGASQGGQLAIVTAGLDPRVTFLSSTYPAYCDVTGYLHGRAGGWPHMFSPSGSGEASIHATDAKIATTAYYDAVNFARRIKAPGIYSWGYNDEVCPPTSYYAAYNTITAPKELMLALETGHWQRQEQSEIRDRWILNALKKD